MKLSRTLSRIAILLIDVVFPSRLLGLGGDEFFQAKLIVVILVVLAISTFRFILSISQLLAKAIPIRGAIFKKTA